MSPGQEVGDCVQVLLREALPGAHFRLFERPDLAQTSGLEVCSPPAPPLSMRPHAWKSGTGICQLSYPRTHFLVWPYCSPTTEFTFDSTGHTSAQNQGWGPSSRVNAHGEFIPSYGWNDRVRALPWTSATGRTEHTSASPRDWGGPAGDAYYFGYLLLASWYSFWKLEGAGGSMGGEIL